MLTFGRDAVRSSSIAHRRRAGWGLVFAGLSVVVAASMAYQSASDLGPG